MGVLFQMIEPCLTCRTEAMTSQLCRILALTFAEYPSLPPPHALPEEVLALEKKVEEQLLAGLQRVVHSGTDMAVSATLFTAVLAILQCLHEGGRVGVLDRLMLPCIRGVQRVQADLRQERTVRKRRKIRKKKKKMKNKKNEKKKKLEKKKLGHLQVRVSYI